MFSKDHTDLDKNVNANSSYGTWLESSPRSISASSERITIVDRTNNHHWNRNNRCVASEHSRLLKASPRGVAGEPARSFVAIVAGSPPQLCLLTMVLLLVSTLDLNQIGSQYSSSF